MQVTIKDIARECGVSVATVSMALSSKKTRVSEKTKAKVIEVARNYNYQPNNTAVSLVNKKSKLIGIVFNEMMERWSVICFGTWGREISVP